MGYGSYVLHDSRSKRRRNLHCPKLRTHMTVIDPGHCYELLSLDGNVRQTLTFVKREGEGYPGNVGSHCGTNLQSVIRALIDRVAYLQGQIPCHENLAIINNLMDCLFLLEHRAARRHGLDASQLTQEKTTHGIMCSICGHVLCKHQL